MAVQARAAAEGPRSGCQCFRGSRLARAPALQRMHRLFNPRARRVPPTGAGTRMHAAAAVLLVRPVAEACETDTSAAGGSGAGSLQAAGSHGASTVSDTAVVLPACDPSSPLPPPVPLAAGRPCWRQCCAPALSCCAAPAARAHAQAPPRPHSSAVQLRRCSWRWLCWRRACQGHALCRPPRPPSVWRRWGWATPRCQQTTTSAMVSTGVHTSRGGARPSRPLPLSHAPPRAPAGTQLTPLPAARRPAAARRPVSPDTEQRAAGAHLPGRAGERGCLLGCRACRGPPRARRRLRAHAVLLPACRAHPPRPGRTCAWQPDRTPRPPALPPTRAARSWRCSAG